MGNPAVRGRPRQPKSSTHINLRVPDGLIARLNEIAAEHGVARSRVIIDSLSAHLNFAASTPNLFTGRTQ